MLTIWKNFWRDRDPKLVVALIAFIIMNLVLAVPYGAAGITVVAVMWAFIVPAFIYQMDHPKKKAPQKYE